ncbi:MAG TPA: DNA polymerase III subunit gamma/tau [Solirubrobacterales bacterium]|nr:DNA polymerase III subunit gamma/tau [Solirubrobacterales bacterium]
MSESTSLYRRHRPGSFDEVVGQTHVVRTLRNAVEQGKVHHAYLFVGSRGTGKTSMAKILARSLNCERGGPTVTPCGECESCVTIAAGTSIDVIEMDAASNRSVDDVRDLRERVAYAPAGGHWKVYILDEAHMLTKEAWNAFLKTLEEPPPNTVFVLATTESHKVMATIADRCQRFDFQRPSLEQISEVLNRVAAAESIEVDEGATAMIARSAQGSFRDALGTLDQLVAFGGSQVELKDVLEMLGAADADLLFEAVDAVIAEDPKGVLLGVERMARSGRDPSQFARDLLAHLRHLLIAQTTGEVPTTFVVTATDTARMQTQAGAIKPANLLRTIDELADALTAVREGDDARLAVEIALLKAARPDLDPDTAGLLRRIERLEAGGTGAPRPAGPAAVGDPPFPATTQERVSPTTSPTGEAAPADDPPHAEGEETAAVPATGAEAVAAPALDPEPSAAADSPAGGADLGDHPPPVAGGGGTKSATGPAGQEPSSAGPGDLSFEEIQQVWPAVLQKLGETAPALAATFEGARPVSYDDSGLQVGFPPAMTFNKKKADSAERRDTLAAAFAAVTGVGLRPTYVMLSEEDEGPPPDTPAPGSDEVDEEELLERLKSEFDAEEVT